MKTVLNQSERIWGGIYALLHFLVMPGLFSWAKAWLKLPSWAVNVCIIYLNALFSLVIYRRFLLDSWKAAVKSIPKTMLCALLGLALYYGLSGLFHGITAAFYPAYSNLNDAQVISQLTDGGILMFLAVIIAAPIGEEAIFRGLLFCGLHDRSPLAAWCVSVGFFALIHVTGYIGMYSPTALLLAFIQYIPAGVCLALAFSLSGTFLCPLLMHITINLIGLLTNL